MVKEQGTKRIAVTILGATGSVGKSALDLIERNPSRYEVVALAAKRDVKQLAKFAKKFDVRFAAIADPEGYRELCDALSGSGIETAAGRDGLLEAAKRQADVVIAAISGAAGLEPTLAALQAKRRVALANKECLVSAGRLFMQTAKSSGAVVLPVDSEHNAVFQALAAGAPESVECVTLTASGGPFRSLSIEKLARVTPEDALKHPVWSMGAKISIDSATLMNKGLELIEAHHLFGLAPEKLDAVIHPQSIVHALVAFHDGSVVAGLSVPDMRLPISYCLNWPERAEWEAPRLNFASLGSLSFEAPDYARFPALKLAREVLKIGGAAPTLLNAANEVAVEAFLARRIGFNDIPWLVREVLERAGSETLKEPETAAEAIAVDHIGRSRAQALLPQFAVKAS